MNDVFVYIFILIHTYSILSQQSNCLRRSLSTIVFHPDFSWFVWFCLSIPRSHTFLLYCWINRTPFDFWFLIFVLDLFSCCFLSCLWFLLFISLVNLFIRTPKCSFNPHYFGVYTIYKLALNRPHSYFFTYIHCMFDIDHYVIFCIIILVLFMSKTDYADVLLLLFYMYWTEIWINWNWKKRG